MAKRSRSAGSGNGPREPALHEIADLRDEPRIAERRAAEHDRVDAALAHALDRDVRVVEIAVADDGNVDGALEARDVLPVGLTAIELFCGARVERHRLHSRALRAPRDVDVHQRVFAPAQPHLHRNGTVDGRDDRAHDRLAAIGIAQTRRAAVGLRHLRRGTAEVDVDDVGSALAHDLSRERHRRRIVAPELRRDRPLEAVLVDHLHRSPAAVLERVRGDELGHG